MSVHAPPPIYPSPKPPVHRFSPPPTPPQSPPTSTMATTTTPYVPPHPAIMRNAHEVVRAAVTELSSLTAGDGPLDVAAFGALFRDLHKYVNLHMIMEEGTDGTSGFFAYLDTVSAAAGGAPAQAVFRAEHVADGAGAQRVLDAVAAGGAAGIREAWGAYAKETEHHLLHEESIMMPIVQTLPAATRGKVLHDHAVRQLVASGEGPFWAEYSARMLSTKGSTKNEPAVATRVFATALQGSTTPDEWEVLGAAFKKGVPAEMWAGLVASHGVDGPGLVAAGV